MAKVVILGGGMAGMSAAHELIRRGFEVEVLEASAVAGGKCRTIYVPAAANVPGEHGFRYFPGFYRHLPATMAEIPFGAAGKTVADNLVVAPVGLMAVPDSEGINLPTGRPSSLADVKALLGDLTRKFGVTASEVDHFCLRLWQMMTSCLERRLAEYEGQTWPDYLNADQFSALGQAFFVHGMCRSLAAADPRTASARTVGQTQVHLLFHAFSNLDRLLSGPTTPLFLDPWLADLTGRGVVYRTGMKVTAFNLADTQIASVEVVDQATGVTHEARGDWYLAAMPVERMAPLVSDQMVAIDPALDGIRQLQGKPRSMNGIQFFLRADVQLNHGHFLLVGSPWAITGVSQARFWNGVPLGTLKGEPVAGILSLCVSEFEVPGTFVQKRAMDCTTDELVQEAWQEIKYWLNPNFESPITDEHLIGYMVDPDLTMPTAAQPFANAEPLFVNHVGTWSLRPHPESLIPNLLLASDYVQTDTDVATMEAANEAARRAVNAILFRSGAPSPPCLLFPMDMPGSVAVLRNMDRIRFHRGQPWTPL